MFGKSNHTIDMLTLSSWLSEDAINEPLIGLVRSSAWSEGRVGREYREKVDWALPAISLLEYWLCLLEIYREQVLRLWISRISFPPE